MTSQAEVAAARLQRLITVYETVGRLKREITDLQRVSTDATIDLLKAEVTVLQRVVIEEVSAARLALVEAAADPADRPMAERVLEGRAQ